MSILTIALTFFLVTNSVGNVPTFLSLVKDLDFEKQRKILFRESIFALIIAIFFQFCGESFLSLLQIKDYAVTLCGGILLSLTALRMIFPNPPEGTGKYIKQDPFLVPIATPLLSGPGLLTMIMLYSKQENDYLKVLSALLIAWIGIITVLTSAPYLQRLLGKKGMTALEQLMGMMLAMMSVQMLVKGMNIFLNTLHHPLQSP